MEIEQEIICIPVKETPHPLLEKIEKTYLAAFPPEERRDFEHICELTKGDTFTAYALLRAEQYVGFITTWQWEEFAFVEHFAIDESARNGGIGRKALTQFLTDWNRPVVLEVELPVEEMSRRRVGFYERLDFVLDANNYQQPPYRKDATWLEMRLMSYGDLDLNTEFERIKHHLYQHVYGI